MKGFSKQIETTYIQDVQHTVLPISTWSEFILYQERLKCVNPNFWSSQNIALDPIAAAEMGVFSKSFTSVTINSHFGEQLFLKIQLKFTSLI